MSEQFAGHGDLGDRSSSPFDEPPVGAFEVGIETDGGVRRLDQQEAQQGRSLLAEVAEALVRLEASGVNPSDVRTRAGVQGPMEYPRIVPDSDGAGLVRSGALLRLNVSVTVAPTEEAPVTVSAVAAPPDGVYVTEYPVAEFRKAIVSVPCVGADVNDNDVPAPERPATGTSTIE